LLPAIKDPDSARRDFETLTDRTKHKHIALRGAPQGRPAVEQALAGSAMKSVAELSHTTLRSLGAALEEAMGKFNPDRTRLPLPRPASGARSASYAFTGTVKEVVFDLKPGHLEAEKALHEHASVHAVGQGAAG